MKKIITALAEPKLNEKLKETRDFEVMSADIQYQEGIIELLQKKSIPDILVVSQSLPGEIYFLDFIEKIRKINTEIIFIILLENKAEEIKNICLAKGIFYVFYQNEIAEQEIIGLLYKINIKNKREKKQKIIKIKEYREEPQINIEKLNDKKKSMEKIKLIKNKKENKNIFFHQIVGVLGAAGSGKSVVVSNLAKQMIKESKKVLLIDFNILNPSLHTIFGVKRRKAEELIMSIDKNLDLLSLAEQFFFSQQKTNKIKLIEEVEKLKEKYDYILIDVSSECFFEDTKVIIQKCDNYIFLVEANLTEIKKTQNLLKMYIQNWNLKKEKIRILFNKINKNAIEQKILKNVFSEFDILGQLKYSENYNLVINQKKDRFLFNTKLKREYEQILKSMNYKEECICEKTTKHRRGRLSFMERSMKNGRGVITEQYEFNAKK